MKGKELLPQKKESADPRERGEFYYAMKAKQLLGREVRDTDVIDVFKGLSREKSEELFQKLRATIRESIAKKKNKEERIIAKEEWLAWAISEADVYRAGDNSDESQS